MFGQFPAASRERPVRHEDIYRPLDEHGQPTPKGEQELARDKTAIAQWSARMASARYSGYKK